MIVSNKNKKKYGKSSDRITGKRRKYMLVLWFHQWGTFLFKTEWVYFNSLTIISETHAKKRTLCINYHEHRISVDRQYSGKKPLH